MRPSPYLCAEFAVEGQEVDAVARARSQGGEEQGGVHGRVQSWRVSHASRRRAAGVEHDQHAAVAFGAPGTHGDFGTSGGRAPVDGPGVVTRNVPAQTVELGALAPAERAGPPVQLAQAGCLRSEQAAAVERRQDAEAARNAVRRLAGDESQGSVRADGDAVCDGFAPARGAELGMELAGSMRRAPRLGAGRRRWSPARRCWAARRRGAVPAGAVTRCW